MSAGIRHPAGWRGDRPRARHIITWQLAGTAALIASHAGRIVAVLYRDRGDHGDEDWWLVETARPDDARPISRCSPLHWATMPEPEFLACATAIVSVGLDGDGVRGP
jgi:hypothetical protein